MQKKLENSQYHGHGVASCLNDWREKALSVHNLEELNICETECQWSCLDWFVFFGSVGYSVFSVQLIRILSFYFLLAIWTV